jgi:hypothetical protein
MAAGIIFAVILGSSAKQNGAESVIIAISNPDLVFIIMLLTGV